MDLLLLKVLHLAGVFALFSSLGATMLGGSKQKSASILHGVSLLFILVIGFAMLGKPGAGQSWWMVKFGIWLFIGIAPILSKKKILPPWIVLILCLIAATAAGYLGIYKPF